MPRSLSPVAVARPIPRLLSLLAVAIAIQASAPASGAILVTHRDLLGGQANFRNHCERGSWKPLFAWSGFDLPEPVKLGVNGAPLSAMELVDPTSGARLVSRSKMLRVANWIDAPGFGTGPALADLAIDSVETFSFFLGEGCYHVGFGISTGITLAGPAQVDAKGSRFRIVATATAGNPTETAIVALQRNVDYAWVSIREPWRIGRVRVTEIGTSPSLKDAWTDQYFTDIEGCKCGDTHAPKVKTNPQ